MRITGLLTAGHDGVSGDAAGLENGGVDDGAKALRCERSVAINEFAVTADLGVLDRLNSFGQSHLGHHECSADALDLLSRFSRALRKERSLLALHANPQAPQFLGDAQWKTAGNDHG